MKKNVLITGANGQLAQQLGNLLAPDYNVRYLTRNVSKSNEYLWDVDKGFIDAEALKSLHVVIHVAGSSIGEKRWTAKQKAAIYASRVNGAQLLLGELQKQNVQLETYISASAIGYYGTVTSAHIHTESDEPGDDFLSEVCATWEAVAHEFESKAVAKRVIVTRIGIILSANKGAVQKIAAPFKWYLGAALGSGKQYMPWIHIHDLCRLIKFTLEKENMSGTFNAVAPDHVSNKQFTQQVAAALNKPVLLPNIPAFVIKIAFGEMSIILLQGSRVASDKIIDEGFKFEYDKLNKALKSLL